MTRINSAIDVVLLTNEHLLAEHHEIIRLVKCHFNALRSGSINKIPNQFTLNTGHVIFFLDKFLFTFLRYKKVYAECVRRGLAVQNFSDIWVKSGIRNKYWKNYKPTETEKELLVQRITDNILNGKREHYHYYNKRITREQAIALLHNKVL